LREQILREIHFGNHKLPVVSGKIVSLSHLSIPYYFLFREF